MPDTLNFRRDGYSDTDRLGFDKYIDTLAGMILDPDFQTPFCIGIYGKWGSGKTSFMRLLEKELLSAGTNEPQPVPVWFNPWRYEKEKHLIIPFLKTIEQALEGFDGRSAIGKALKGAAQKIGDAATAFAYGLTAECKLGPIGVSFDAAKAADREEALGEKRRAAAAEKLSRKLTSIYYDINNRLQEAVNSQKFRIVVFIDDLDRCLPEKAVELLESIKLFLNLEGYLFILGVDRGVVEKGINCHYHFYEQNGTPKSGGTATGRVISPDEYLDKIIQMPLELPPIEPTRKRDFILNLLGQAEAYREFAEIIETGVDDNPRSLTRFVNLLAFTGRLAETIKHSILEEDGPQAEPEERKQLLRDYFTPPFYVKWSVLIFRHPNEYRLIRSNWRHLLDLQEAALSGGKETAADQQQPRLVQVPASLARVLKMGEPFPDEPWLIQKFVFLAKSIEIPGKTRPAGIPNFKASDWEGMVLIPRGPFLYGDGKNERVIQNDFYLDVRPVTNKQFEQFIAAGGYERHEYWCKEGWVWREKRNFTEPTNWKDNKCNKGDHPVIGVSWYEADAYARWAGKRLPSEEEWEKAARGDAGLQYPWGEDFDQKKCNTRESGINGTTAVYNYPEGASPHGCIDMAGNVWEWTNSSRVKGGSWVYTRDAARCAYSIYNNGGERKIDIGFRCAKAAK